MLLFLIKLKLNLVSAMATCHGLLFVVVFITQFGFNVLLFIILSAVYVLINNNNLLHKNLNLIYFE